MRLLLDEHYSAQIAAGLRSREHDVATVAELGISGSSDEEVLVAATRSGRALLTNNARDFVPLARSWAAAGRSHHGLILSSDESMPRSRETIGRYVDALEDLLDAHPADDALADQVRWLRGRDERAEA